MIDERYFDLITDYIDGSITDEDRERIDHLIDQGKIDMPDLKEMEMLYRDMGKLPDAEPREALRDGFYAMLEAEKTKIKKPPSLSSAVSEWFLALQERLELRQLAYACGIFLAGMLIGNWATPFQNYRAQLSDLSSEVSQMREVMMLSMLDNNSPTERLKAVNISSEIRTADYKVIEALLNTLANDSNVNVRLAAVEALIPHGSNPRVRKGLINAIAEQNAPQVQAALADAMIALQESRSVREFRALLDKNGLDENVREKLENTIAALS